MKRIAWILLAIVVLWGRIYGRGAAQTAPPTIQVTAGFDGYCRNDAWCPLRVVVENEGADIEGELRVVVPSGAGAEPDTYSRRMVLPAHSRKAYFLSYLPGTGLTFRSRLPVELVAGDGVLARTETLVAWFGEKDRLYGVVSREPSALNFLRDVAPAGGKAMVARLSLDALPPNPLAWEALDVLVLNDVDTSVLDDEQRRILETWVAHGGHLIVGGGAGAARTAAGLTETGLLPVTITGMHQVGDLWALGEMIGATVVAGPFPVAGVSPLDGGQVSTVEQEGMILVARRPFGAGWVDWIAFDAGLDPFADGDANVRLWERIVEVQGVGAPLLTVKDGYAARQAVNALPGLRRLSAWEILFFMLVYVIVIGPLNYVVLRKLKRSEWAWLTIPLIILGFTAFAYATGFNLRGGVAIVHRLGVVYVPRGARVGRVSQVVGVFSPRRTRYDVRVAGVGLRAVPRSDYGGMDDAQPLRIVADGDDSILTGLRVDVGGIQPFLVEGYADVPGVEADLRLLGDDAGPFRLEGDVRCGEVPLKDAVLIVGDNERRLGDLDAGERVHVRLVLSGTAPSGAVWTTSPPLAPPGPGGVPLPTSLPVAPLGPGGVPLPAPLPERILGPGNYWEDRELFRRYQFLQALFPYYEPGPLPVGAHLVAWVEEDVPLPVEVEGRPSLHHALALYVYELPLGLELGRSSAVPPALITRQVDSTTGYVSLESSGAFYMDAGSEITFRFTVWPEVMVSRVDELVLEMRGSGSGVPTVSLWDWEDRNWDRQTMKWEARAIPQAGRYVSLDGRVLVRLKMGSGAFAGVDTLVITIRGQR